MKTENLLFIWDADGYLEHIVSQEFKRVTKLFKTWSARAVNAGGSFAIYRNVPKSVGIEIPVYWNSDR